MKFNNQKDLIISLIKDDLLNTKLINGLTKLGLDPSDYMLELSDTVFNLMGLRETSYQESSIVDHYLLLTDKVNDINVTISHKPLQVLAMEIYLELLKYQESAMQPASEATQ